MHLLYIPAKVLQQWSIVAPGTVRLLQRPDPSHREGKGAQGRRLLWYYFRKTSGVLIISLYGMYGVGRGGGGREGVGHGLGAD